ncbi:MAG: adenylate/guanylate cyclase domain-containing protein [Nitrospirae bacterium]|nr:adenylate/guanylate cyclase domain-containing protein [Nitrospirota bacterium]
MVVSSLITLAFLFADLVNPPFIRNTLDLLEMKSLDIRFRIRDALHPRRAGDALAIVAIDEKSLAEVGRWPWSRVEMARLVDALAEAKPRVIAFDILFSEPEVSPSRALLEGLKTDLSAGGAADARALGVLARREREADADARFAEALGRAGTVVLPAALIVPTAYQTPMTPAAVETPEFLVSSSFGMVKRVSREKIFVPIEAESVITPLPPLARAASALGSVYYQPDRDGVLRWEYLALKYGDEYYPSFSLQIARAALGIPREAMKFWMGEAIEVGDIRIPTDERGRMLIDYVGREGAFPTVSAADVLGRRLPPDALRDKIVLVGTTALGTYDLKITPLAANLPGVEKNATIVHDILTKSFLIRTEAMKLADGFFIVLFGAAVWLIVPRGTALRGATTAAVMLVGYLALAQYLFDAKGLWINLLYPSATLVLCYTSLTVLRFRTEERRALEVRRMFSSYISPTMVAELVRDPDKAKLGGQRKELTVLFSDVRGFTAFSEAHQPEEVVAALNEYLQAMTDVIFHWNGTLDKFVGDAIMVFWGAPIDQPNHAELAVRCALHMRHRLAELQAKWRAEGREPLDAGIGINTGEMVVGNMGAEGKKMDYTLIGDNVNLGARVESLTRQHNAGILITDSTYRAIEHLVEAREVPVDERRARTALIRHPDRRKAPKKIGRAAFKDLGELAVKGRAKTVRVYEVTGLKKERA